MKEVVYSDFNFNFINDLDFGIEFIKNVESVNQSIKNILLTVKGEVPFNPMFGSNLNQLLFEKVSPVTEALLKDEIETALNNFEPRIEIIDVRCQGEYDLQIYNIEIEYLILFLNVSAIFKFDLQLKGL
jgi:phage baseplate assembly protein W